MQQSLNNLRETVLNSPRQTEMHMKTIKDALKKYRHGLANPTDLSKKEQSGLIIRRVQQKLVKQNYSQSTNVDQNLANLKLSHSTKVLKINNDNDSSKLDRSLSVKRQKQATDKYE